MRRFLLPAAAAIVCLTNIGALTLGALNRSGAPDAEMTLTERELRLVPARDSTATSLQLTFVQRFDAEGQWLTCPKLETLGVSCAPPPAGSDMASSYARQPERRAFAVLEYDGPAWQGYRDLQIRGMREMARKNPTAEQNVEKMMDRSSRLVAIDAGNDADALRARYPDGSRYLIVEARISIYGQSPADRKGAIHLNGSISAASPSTINVPKPYSSIFGSMPPDVYDLSPGQGPRYWVTVRYGRFHEPWIVNAGLFTTSRPSLVRNP